MRFLRNLVHEGLTATILRADLRRAIPDWRIVRNGLFMRAEFPGFEGLLPVPGKEE
jgi:hypothetical protein